MGFYTSIQIFYSHHTPITIITIYHHSFIQSFIHAIMHSFIQSINHWVISFHSIPFHFIHFISCHFHFIHSVIGVQNKHVFSNSSPSLGRVIPRPPTHGAHSATGRKTRPARNAGGNAGAPKAQAGNLGICMCTIYIYVQIYWYIYILKKIHVFIGI